MQSLLIDAPSNTVQQLIASFAWSDWIHKDTREGPRMMRYATVPSGPLGKAFWEHYRENKAQWFDVGIGVGKWGQAWSLSQWTDMEGKIPESAKRRAAEARAAESRQFLPADWTPDDVTLTSPQAERLLEYQKPAAIRLKRALLAMTTPEGFHNFGEPNGNALDASDTGTGKTFIALVVCAELGLRPCVIAPLAVLPSWKRAAAFLDVPLGWLINYDKLRNGRSGLGRWRLKSDITKNPHDRGEMFVFDYFPPNGTPALIFDECQKCKSPDTKQGKILRDSARQGHKIICLSATAAKDPTEMRNLGAALGLHDGTAAGFDEFCKQYGCFSSTYGMKFDWKKRKLLEELHRKIYPIRGQRIRIADVPEFPETVVQAEALDTGNTAMIVSAYNEMESKLDEIASSNRTNKQAEGLAAIMHARRIAEKAKLDLFVDLAKEAFDEGKSVVCFVNFRDHVQELGDRLETKCLIWGGQKPDERQDNIDRFNADKERFCVISLQAGGAGLSLHDLNGDHPRLALISPSFSCIDLKQALGRVHRAGAKTKSFQRIIFAAETIEEEICESMRKKLGNLETINDGDLQSGGTAEKLQKCKLSHESEELL